LLWCWKTNHPERLVSSNLLVHPRWHVLTHLILGEKYKEPLEAKQVSQ
jgi:hypothetical protein